MEKTKQSPLKWLGFVVAVAMGVFGARYVMNSQASANMNPAKVAAELQEVAATENAKGPRMVDADTRWERTTAGPGSRLEYLYTMVNVKADEVPEDRKAAAKPMIMKDLCANKMMQDNLRRGVVYSYVYNGNDNKRITQFDIALIDCKLPPV